MNGPPPAETRVRECDCPPFVERCVHVDELRAWFVTPERLSEEAVRRGRRHKSITEYHVSFGHYDGFYETPVSNGMSPPLGVPLRDSYINTKDEARALAFFYEAEAALLAGGDA